MTGTIIINLAADPDPDSIAFRLGEIVGLSLLPIAGVVCLIIGLRRRFAAGRQPPQPYSGYSPGPGWSQPGPPGQPPQGNYPGPPAQANYPGYATSGHPQQWAGGYQQVPPSRPKSKGTGLIITGVVLLFLALLSLLGRAARSDRAAPDLVTETPAVQILW